MTSKMKTIVTDDPDDNEDEKKFKTFPPQSKGMPNSSESKERTKDTDSLHESDTESKTSKRPRQSRNTKTVSDERNSKRSEKPGSKEVRSKTKSKRRLVGESKKSGNKSVKTNDEKRSRSSRSSKDNSNTSKKTISKRDKSENVSKSMKNTKSKSKSESKVASKLKCLKDGIMYETARFIDYYDPCLVCDCFSSGKTECTRQTCEAPKCGDWLRRKSDEECCEKCSSKCDTEVCEILKCPISEQFFKIDSCCPECGCKYNGTMVPEGQVGDPCDRCVCKKGKVRCKKPECPEPRLQCVDPVYDEHCQLSCKYKTCKKGNVIIKYGEFKDVGKKVCTCVGTWSPHAFCASRKISKDIKALQKKKCIAKDFLIK